MVSSRWTVPDAAAAGGLAIALAATADAAWSLYGRFAVDLSGLAGLERTTVALWDFRPLPTAVFTAGAVLALLAVRDPGRALVGFGPWIRKALVVLMTAHAALAVPILAAAGWIAATGRVGAEDELGFVYSSGERAVTLVTQLAAWLPLGAVLAVLALRLARLGTEEEHGLDVVPARTAPDRSLGNEMEDLWRERLAFGPGRERARVLLERIRALETAGDVEAARQLAEEMRSLGRR